MKKKLEEEAIEMESDSKIYVAGHRGLVGSALLRRLAKNGFSKIVYRTHSELDLTNQVATEQFFAEERPDYVFLTAAKVGGIHANNTYPADFIYENLQIQSNVIHWAYKYGAKKLCFLGSSCIYPKFASLPLKEEYLLTGSLEPTNEPFAVAKLAGIKLCESYNRQFGTNFISAIPANLYGPGDNFDPMNSHVLGALVQRFVSAKKARMNKVTIWGTGKPLREFLYVDDLADGCIFLMEKYSGNDPVNIGSGTETSIKALAVLIAKYAGYNGSLEFDTSKADGTPRKVVDTTKLTELGWRAATTLDDGLQKTIEWYESTVAR